MEQYHKVVQNLVDLIETNGWTGEFEKAIEHAHRWHIPQLDDIRSLNDYLGYINGLLYWVPSENRQGKEVYDHICKFYFILDQPPVRGLQNRVVPHDKAPPLTRRFRRGW